MRIITIALALCVSIAIAASAFAGTWYVATTGNDANAGTITAPFATINKGVSMLTTPGDMLYVRGGTYNQLVTIYQVNGNSTTQTYIYIQSYPGETAVIDGAGLTGKSAVVGIINSSFVKFYDFEVKNGIEAGIKIYDSNNVRVAGNYVHDNQTFGIVASTASASNFGTNHHVKIESNTVKRNVMRNSSRTLTSGWEQAIGTLRVRDVTIADNYVSENYGEGVDCVLTDGCNILRNTVYDNYGVNIYLDNATRAVVDRNFAMAGRVTNYTDYYRNSHGAHGIALGNETYTINGVATQNPLDDIRITNNIVVKGKYNLVYYNSYYGGGLHHTLIANNTFYGGTDMPLYIEGTTVHDTTTIQNNIVYATGTSYAYAPSAGIAWSYNNWYNGTSGTQKTGSGDVLANPLLVSAGSGAKADYKLTSTSPCINAGTAVTNLTVDYFGEARSAPLDIGADEY